MRQQQLVVVSLVLATVQQAKVDTWGLVAVVVGTLEPMVIVVSKLVVLEATMATNIKACYLVA